MVRHEKMMPYEFEIELQEALDRHDELLRQCARDDLAFWEFNDRYSNFYWAFPLDGHESNAEEKAILVKHRNRIEPHRIVQEDILSRVCSDEDAEKKHYKHAGRISSKEAILKIAKVVSVYLKKPQD
jgi:hypothetical protein